MCYSIRGDKDFLLDMNTLKFLLFFLSFVKFINSTPQLYSLFQNDFEDLQFTDDDYGFFPVATSTLKRLITVIIRLHLTTLFTQILLQMMIQKLSLMMAQLIEK